jgi:hypothetical protein
MKELNAFHKKIASPLNILIFFVIFMTLFITFRIITPEFEKLTGGLQIPDIAIISNGNNLYSLFQSYGESGRSFYNYIQLVDAFYPLFYGLFFLSVIVFYFKRLLPEQSPLRYLIVVPYITVISDYSENLTIFIMNRTYPEKFGIIQDISFFVSSLKWIFFIISVVIILLSTIIFFTKKISGKLNPSEL